MKRLIPYIDIGECTKCGGCIEVNPNVFWCNDNTGHYEVVFLDQYPQEDVDEAIKNCPADCISWEEE